MSCCCYSCVQQNPFYHGRWRCYLRWRPSVRYLFRLEYYILFIVGQARTFCCCPQYCYPRAGITLRFPVGETLPVGRLPVLRSATFVVTFTYVTVVDRVVGRCVADVDYHSLKTLNYRLWTPLNVRATVLFDVGGLAVLLLGVTRRAGDVPRHCSDGGVGGRRCPFTLPLGCCAAGG